MCDLTKYIPEIVLIYLQLRKQSMVRGVRTYFDNKLYFVFIIFKEFLWQKSFSLGESFKTCNYVEIIIKALIFKIISW